jgi:hypothetical protein
MQDSTKHLFVKFKIEEETGRMSSLLVSEEKTRIDSWLGGAEKEESTEETAVYGGDQRFRDIARNFPKSIEVFRRTVPFIMQTLPMLRNYHDDNLLRKFASDNGELLESGKFETYRLNIDHIVELSRRLENAAAIARGVRSFLECFWWG